MLFDCFTYNGETDLLEIRLNELDKLVDYFVIVESKLTFTNKPKKTSNPATDARFKNFSKKIIYHSIDSFPDSYDIHWTSRWKKVNTDFQREHYQRDQILEALRKLLPKPSDKILLSDLDEIPFPKTLKKNLNSKSKKIILFEMINYYYFINQKLYSTLKTGSPRLTTFKNLTKYLPQGIRDLPFEELNTIPSSAWHFSTIGTAENILKKLRSYSHSEYNVPPHNDLKYISTCREIGVDFLKRPFFDSYTLELEKNLPKYVIKNKQKFRHLFRAKTINLNKIFPEILKKELTQKHQLEIDAITKDHTIHGLTYYKEAFEMITSSKNYKLWQTFNTLKKPLRFFKKITTSKPSLANTYDYYHKNTFWNDHPLVVRYINKLISGNPKIDWMQYSKQKYYPNSENLSLLSVACGNGWQDRDLDKIYNFSKITGVDISDSLLEEARQKGDTRYSYYKRNLNEEELPEGKFDLAINLAGLHHVENMDHIVKQVKSRLNKGGYFFHFEYIGPKRNQYSDKDLDYMNWMQKQIPESLVGREKIARPSLEVMLKEDPSEAVGSEIIIPTLKKHFKINEIKYFNGGLLYMVLYNKIQNFKLKNNKHNQLLLEKLAIEEKMTNSGKVKPLFAFIACQKK